MLARKVYSAWAFDRDGVDKANINRQIYEKLKSKVKWCYLDYDTKKSNCTMDDLYKYCCIECIGRGYGTMKYRILSNPYVFSKDELALICDTGNLCFGYRMEGSDVIIIYID
ncbi:MAG: hypothetical protein ACI4E1_07590 [Lachnospira sp.]